MASVIKTTYEHFQSKRIFMEFKAIKQEVIVDFPLSNKENKSEKQMDPNAPKINYLDECPIEIHDQINSSLSIYDSFNLSSANRSLRALFPILGLKPGYKKELETLVMTKNEAVQTIKLFTILQIFDKYEELRKAKYLLCDRPGLQRLKHLGLDSHLMKQKIANGELTDTEILSNKQNLLRVIQTELKGPLLTQDHKNNLQSKVVQECIFVKWLTIEEAKLLPESARESLKLECVQKALGNNQIAKQAFLDFNCNTLTALSCVNPVMGMNKNFPTISEAIKFPVHTIILLKSSSFLTSLVDNNITKQEIFALRRIQVELALSLIEFTNNFYGERQVPEIVQWVKSQSVTDARVLQLRWVKSALSFYHLKKGTRNGKGSITDLAKQFLVMKDLLQEIEQKHGEYTNKLTKKTGVATYFKYEWDYYCAWDDMQTAQLILSARPDILRTLFLSDLGEQISKLVKENRVSIGELINFTPGKITIFSSNEVHWAIEQKLLTQEDLRILSREQIVDKAQQLFSEKDRTTECTIQ
jgi:hypothetical protein